MSFIERFMNSVDWATALLLTHLLTILGFLLALLILSRLFEERRQPSNIFAWSLLILAIPYVGVPLYFLVGGRKIRKLTRQKEKFEQTHPENYPEAIHCLQHPPVNTGMPPEIKGNHVEMVRNGEDFFERLCRSISQAKQSIRITTYILGNDPVGHDLIARLAKKASRGVEVKLLLDGFGSFGRSRTVCRPLKKAGGEVANFLPVIPLQTHWSANLRNHRKLAIFDHQSALVGGQNLDIRFTGPTPSSDRFEDCALEVEGPAVAELGRLFAGDWGFATRQPMSKVLGRGFCCPLPRGESLVQVVASGPDVPHDPLYEQILALIQEAREEIVLVTPYFVPDEVIFRSLLVKCHAGKRVTLVIPKRSNHPFLDRARNSFLRDLVKAGVRVLGFHPKMLHAKVIVVDRRVGMVGSANVDQRSLFLNFEVGLFLRTGRDVAEVLQWVREIEDSSDPIHLSARESLPLRKRVVEDFAYLVAPLL